MDRIPGRPTRLPKQTAPAIPVLQDTQTSVAQTLQVAVETSAVVEEPGMPGRVIVPVVNRRPQPLPEPASFKWPGRRAAPGGSASTQSSQPLSLHKRPAAPVQRKTRTTDASLQKSLIVRNESMRLFINRLGMKGEVHTSWAALAAACDEIIQGQGWMMNSPDGTSGTEDMHAQADRNPQLLAAFEVCLATGAKHAVGKLAHMEIVLGLLASDDAVMLLTSINRQTDEIYKEMASAAELCCNHALAKLDERFDSLQPRLSWGDIPRLQRIALHLHTLATLPARAGAWGEKIGLNIDARAAASLAGKINALIGKLDDRPVKG